MSFGLDASAFTFPSISIHSPQFFLLFILYPFPSSVLPPSYFIFPSSLPYIASRKPLHLNNRKGV